MMWDDHSLHTGNIWVNRSIFHVCDYPGKEESGKNQAFLCALLPEEGMRKKQVMPLRSINFVQ